MNLKRTQNSVTKLLEQSKSTEFINELVKANQTLAVYAKQPADYQNKVVLNGFQVGTPGDLMSIGLNILNAGLKAAIDQKVPMTFYDEDVTKQFQKMIAQTKKLNQIYLATHDTLKPNAPKGFKPMFSMSSNHKSKSSEADKK